jgi:putative N6-adenine-specific DNA methylase
VTRIRYFATCARGLEPILAQELAEIRAVEIQPGRGGVAFQGPRSLVMRANLCLRTAIRILQPVMSADVMNADELYEAIKAFDWAPVMTPDQTLAVDANVRNSNITHSQFAARRVKDAICDQFRDRIGRRPSVDADRPMVGVNLHIDKNHMVLSLDSTGDSLHKRGYRPVQTIAPINEALAAGLIMQTGWKGEVPFLDPMCGSGTFCIEAAWLAANRPPGLTRKHFGFMGWRDFDPAEFADLRDELRRKVKSKLEHGVFGSDERTDVIEHAQTNAKAAGVGHLVKLNRQPFHEAVPPSETGVLICNPPYGERIGEEKELKGLYRQLGELFRTKWAGWQCLVFTGNPELAKELGETKVEMPFFNGKIACRLILI